jgi:hypothetical protein
MDTKDLRESAIAFVGSVGKVGLIAGGSFGAVATALVWLATKLGWAGALVSVAVLIPIAVVFVTVAFEAFHHKRMELLGEIAARERGLQRVEMDNQKLKRTVAAFKGQQPHRAALDFAAVYERDGEGVNHLRLVVTNRGPSDEFHAQILGWSKDASIPARMPAPRTVRWVGGQDRYHRIATGASEYLEIAQVEYGPPDELTSTRYDGVQGWVYIKADWMPKVDPLFGAVNRLFTSDHPWVQQLAADGLTEADFRHFCLKSGRDPDQHAAEILGDTHNCFAFFHYFRVEDFAMRVWTLTVGIGSHNSGSTAQHLQLTAFGRPEDDPIGKAQGPLDVPMVRITLRDQN